jgi:hypothetical protein
LKIIIRENEVAQFLIVLKFLHSSTEPENGGKGSYKKVHELIDNGNWGDAMKECGAETNGQAITWGSPIVILKANDFKFDIYDVEIRK